MKTQHQGSYVFGGSIMDLAQLGVSATADESMLKKNRNALPISNKNNSRDRKNRK
jgi:hypothetical protein